MAIINVPNDKITIQGAVNSALESDVILIENGIYHETVSVGTNNIRIVANGKKSYS